MLLNIIRVFVESSNLNHVGTIRERPGKESRPVGGRKVGDSYDGIAVSVADTASDIASRI